jgi:hypothetical protein
MTWNALVPTAINYVWLGETEISGSLEATATYRNGGLDVDWFESSSHFRDMSRLIEDELGVPESGTGTENYHRDETYTFTDDTTGSGSYVDGAADADYQVAWAGTFAVHNVLTVEGDHTTGTDEDGYPYDLVFNFTSDRTAGGSGSITSDYHDGDDGIELTGVIYALSAGTTPTFHHWGTRNGVGFDTTNTSGESLGVSLSLPGEPRPISAPDLREAYPFVGRDSSVFLINFDDGSSGIGVGLVKKAVGHAPQEWYNHQVERIGKDAEKKVVKDIVVRPMVLQAIQDSNPGGAFPKVMGQISLPGKGQTIAIGLQRGDDLDKRIAFVIQSLEGPGGWTGAKLASADFVAQYAVDQANQNPRSGKCVVSYIIRLNFSGTKGGVPVTRTNLFGIDGVFLLQDGKLERMQLQVP